MQNLSSQEETDWKRKCDHQRMIARDFPCFHGGQALMECYRFHLGPWNFTFTLDRFIKPATWHGSVSLFKEVGTEAVTDEQGRRLFEAPQDALMAVTSWNTEDMDIARQLLADVFGDLIQRDTIVVVNPGMFSLHYLVRSLDS